MSKPKDNENPTVYAVEETTNNLQRRKNHYHHSVYKELRNDAAVRHALVDARQWTNLSLINSMFDHDDDIGDDDADLGGIKQPMLLFQPANFHSYAQPKKPREDHDEMKEEDKEELKEAITALEIFEWIRHIQDPEHPHSLEALGVVSSKQVELQTPPDSRVLVQVQFSPTIPHCSMATLIGLCLTVQLQRCLPKSYLIKVAIQPGAHVSEQAINKQLQDKERVCAALENPHLYKIVQTCIGNGMRQKYEANVMA